ncbi:DUF6929 family protein [Maribacter thermophilus]|uniref:DUF6929 family protein n=1 Tax=Maribacter thermophilus TaxID=1197874 RepID=UPI00069C1F99|nr:hypothetical protein [Maribacter thermophilus]
MKRTILLLALILIMASCKNHPLAIEVLNSKTIKDFPSGSGLVAVENDFYAIGDDSPFLFQLNTENEVVSKTQIHAAQEVNKGRIPKTDKPDFESLEMIGTNELVAFGSGSKSPQRDVFLHIFLEDSLRIKTYDISPFYDNLRALKAMENEDLNIEAVAFQNDKIYLFNRGKNLIFEFIYDDFLAYLEGSIPFPKPTITEFTLPKINGMESGFSGATIVKDTSLIIFTASVENSSNSYDDGEILGSFIGTIPISNNTVLNSYEATRIPNIGEPLKVESVTIANKIGPKKYKVALVTDDDKGNSIKIDCQINL